MIAPAFHGPDAGRLRVGQQFSKVAVEDLKRTQLVQYAGASGDYNPLHSDDVFARETAGFPGVFAHGMLTMALTGNLLSEVVGIQHVVRFGGRFKAQVWPGDTLIVHLEITDIELVDTSRTRIEAALRTVNQADVEVFAGRGTAFVPAVG